MEVEVKIEPSGRQGVVPIDSYLFDAAARLGVSIEKDCGRKGECNSCAVKVIKGAELLSQPTKAEMEHLTPESRKKGDRLSCQAKIEKTGEITIMTTAKPKIEISEFEAFKKNFAELSLDEKVAKLLDLEAITLSDTLSFIANLPYTIGEKIRDGLAQIGFQKEEAEKQAKRPVEHKTEAKAEEETIEPKKTAPKKSPVAKKTAAAPKKPVVEKEAATEKATTEKTSPKAKKTPTRKTTAKTSVKPKGDETGS